MQRGLLFALAAAVGCADVPAGGGAGDASDRDGGPTDAGADGHGFVDAAPACDYYAAPDGTGEACTASVPCPVAALWPHAAPGVVLCLADGVYAGPDTSIDPPDGLSGTAQAPIVVRAEHDGRVRIDGQYERAPIALHNNAYFVIEGVNVHSGAPTRVAGAVISVSSGAHDNLIRRVVAWDAMDENTDVIGVHSHGDDNVFEDVAAFGVARKVMSCSQGGDRCICRRCWLRWEGSTNVGPKMSLSMWYNSVGEVAENVIATWDNGSMPNVYTTQSNGELWTGNFSGTHVGGAPDQAYGCFSRDRIDNGTVARARIYGSIAYIREGNRFDPDALVALSGEDDVQVINSVAYVEPGASLADKRPFALGDGATGSGLVAQELTGVGAMANQISSQWVQGNIEHASSVAQLSDSIYVGQGAHICRRYERGAETTVPLWPWPMNQRILEATQLAASPDHQHLIYQGNPPVATWVNDPHAPVDVTATIEAMFGPIPPECRTP